MAICPSRGALYSKGGSELALKMVSSPLGRLDRDLLYFMRDHYDSWQVLEASRPSAAKITVVRCKDQVFGCKHSTEAGEGKSNAPPHQECGNPLHTTGSTRTILSIEVLHGAQLQQPYSI